jgi:uncharacterized protein (TIRG00374 family)
VLSTATIERLFDGVWLALTFALISLLVPLPLSLLRAADTLDVVLLTSVVVLMMVVRGQSAGKVHSSDVTQSKMRQWISSNWRNFAVSLQQVSLSRVFYLAFGVSFFVIFLQALSFWLIMWAYGLQLSLWVGVAVFIIVSLGTAIPNAPANVGSYQFFTVLALSLFGVEKTAATGFSVVSFILLTVPLWLLGFLAITRNGMSLGHLHANWQTDPQHS